MHTKLANHTDKPLNKVSRRAVLAGAAASSMLMASGARAAATPLTVGYIPVLGSAQIFVIEGEGWARDANIELKTVRFESGPAMIQALASGTLDLYLAGVGPILVARGAGIDVQVVASAAIEEMAILARGRFASLAAGGDVGAAIAAFTKAEGRKPKIATQPAGSVPDTTLRYWLREMRKIDFDTVEIVAMGIDATQQAFLAGAVDGATMREPTVTLVRDRDPKAVILASGAEMFPKQPGSVLAALNTSDPVRRDAIVRLVGLHRRATALLNTEPKRAARLSASWPLVSCPCPSSNAPWSRRSAASLTIRRTSSPRHG
jgi:NitT/TauT family transport system substrate-binding protein